MSKSSLTSLSLIPPGRITGTELIGELKLSSVAIGGITASGTLTRLLSAATTLPSGSCELTVA